MNLKNIKQRIQNHQIKKKKKTQMTSLGLTSYILTINMVQ